MTIQPTWKGLLSSRIEEQAAQAIERFELQLVQRKAFEIDEKQFALARSRVGAYGQRYDNGVRYDGAREREIEYPQGKALKGPNTLWDAPGMQRIKLPLGMVSADQLEVMCELAEEYSNSVLHVTTRQDIQQYYVHIEDVPDFLRRLAAAQITTIESCGNSVRNVTQCPFAGIAPGEAFDTTAHAHSLAQFLLGHPDAQGMGRKFKIAFDGCESEGCAIAKFNDLGFIATLKQVDGKPTRGFEVYVGGGLGASPQIGQVLYEFLPELELWQATLAVIRVFARHGEKENRARARLKFLLRKLGLEEFRRLVEEERQLLSREGCLPSRLGCAEAFEESPIRPAGQVVPTPAIAQFLKYHVVPQRQAGYYAVKVKLPLGDFSADQGRRMAALARAYSGAALRLTTDQNLVFRWVSGADISALRDELTRIGLGAPEASTMTDIVACPGTSTCKLAMVSSRGLARELHQNLSAIEASLSEAARSLRIKCSGCFNACGQHHLADIGYLGSSRTVDGLRVPHFQIVVGSSGADKGSELAVLVGAVPARRVADLTVALLRRFDQERKPDETFSAYTKRIGKAELRAMVDEFSNVPSYADDPSFYVDLGDSREFILRDAKAG